MTQVVPVLWGTRAILRDTQGRLQVIDLEGGEPEAEIVGDEPAPGTTYQLIVAGFTILARRGQSYSYLPDEKRLSSPSLGLPDCTLGPDSITAGTNLFSGLRVEGAEVGLEITADRTAAGASLPEGLSRHLIPASPLPRGEAFRERASAIMALVADKLSSPLMRGYELIHDPALTRSGVGRPDFVLQSLSSDMPDLLIEVNYASRLVTMVGMLGSHLMRVARFAALYETDTGRPSLPVLFVIFDRNELSEKRGRAVFEQRAEELRQLLVVPVGVSLWSVQELAEVSPSQLQFQLLDLLQLGS